MTPYATKARPYKDFLTPALHRRLIAALSICLGVCYIESIIIGDKSSLFWAWFPLGRTGIRAGLIFMSALFIFLLRVAQLHVGYRTSFSGWDTFRLYAFRFQTIQTATWHCFSAYLFSEIFIWSASADAGLSRTKYIPRTNRSTLNERPIYLTCFFFFLALTQTGFHLFYDYDRIDIPVSESKLTGPSPTKQKTSTFQQLKPRLQLIVLSSIKRAVLITLISPLIYSFNFFIYPYSIRRLAWGINRSWAKIFWLLPKSSSLPTTWPFHWSILWTCATSGSLLIVLWEVSNVAFSISTAQKPLKNNKPITHESRDPNGSLLTGLRGKKLQTRVYAFWELVCISKESKIRRKSIFEDIDRTGGSCWLQILNACLEVITGIQNRIDNFERSSVYNTQITEIIPSLPRLSEPLRDGLESSGDIFTIPPTSTSPARGVTRTLERIAKSKGQSSSKVHYPRTKKLIKAAENTILTKQQKQMISKTGRHGIVKRWILLFLETRFGWPFRQEYRRKLNAVVLGTPYGDVSIFVNTVESIVTLAVFSLSEDPYGNVQRDIKVIITTLTATIAKLEGFKTSLNVHWTDVLAVQESPEVDLILATLKNGLSDILSAFGKYSENLGLSQRELRMAKEAMFIARPQATEMQEIS